MNFKILTNKNLSSDATDFYLNMLTKAADSCGDISWVSQLRQLSSNDIVIVVDAKDCLKVVCYSFFFNLNLRVFTWYQGVVPEEAFLVFRSYIRYFYWSIFEFFALFFSQHNIFVSDAMLLHYKKKYRFRKDNYTVIPCFNVDGFKVDNIDVFRKKKDLLVYAGSLAHWQKFSDTIDAFLTIRNSNSNYKFKVLTREIAKANQLLQEKGIFDAEVKYVSPDKLFLELLECKYGFILRDDIAVNNVATPTKINSYLSCGVVPILSSCVGDFKVKMKGGPIVFVDDYNVDLLQKFISFDSCYLPEKIFLETRLLNDSFYDINRFIKIMKGVFDGTL